MIRFMALAAALAVSACTPPQSGDTQEAAPTAEASAAATQTAAVTAPAGASEAITAWYRERLGATLIEPVEVFYGDFTGDGAADAMAWAYHNTDGNSTGHVLALFRNEGSQMTFVRTQDEVQGSEPTNVAIGSGRITLTTKVHLPTDPGCCPTGAQEWTIATN